MILSAVCLLAICVFAEGAPPVDLSKQDAYDGDIILNPRQRNGILKVNRWTGGTIYYERLNDTYTPEQKNIFYNALRTIEANTCVRFIPRTNQAIYLKVYTFVFPRRVCQSTIGMNRGKDANYMYLTVPSPGSREETCWRQRTILHELLHVVGLFHEHSRYDRDNYVTIHRENIAQGGENQFSLVRQDQSSTYGLPYDYLSIMHYHKYSGSVNQFFDKITIETKNRYYQNLIGTLPYASATDWEKVRRIYDCWTG